MNKKRFAIRISGRVFRVGFRFHATKMAYSTAVNGFITYNDDTIYIEAEGDPLPLARFVSWCRKGPPGAKVMQFVTEEIALKGCNSFEMK